MGTRCYHLKGCRKCGGDLMFDEGDWRCWQCGQSHYMAQEPSVEMSDSERVTEPALSGPQGSAPALHPRSVTPGESPRRSRRRTYAPRSERNIDAIVRAKQISDDRWWERNRQIIEHLDQGRSVQQIAKLLGRGDRQIRVVRERLVDLRAAASDE